MAREFWHSFTTCLAPGIPVNGAEESTRHSCSTPAASCCLVQLPWHSINAQTNSWRSAIVATGLLFCNQLLSCPITFLQVIRMGGHQPLQLTTDQEFQDPCNLTSDQPLQLSKTLSSKQLLDALLSNSFSIKMKSTRFMGERTHLWRVDIFGKWEHPLTTNRTCRCGWN